MRKLFRTCFIIMITLVSAKSFAHTKTPLMKAASDGDKAAVQKILKSKKTNIDAEDSEERRTALYFAINNEHNNVIQLLIDAGARLENLSEGKETALFMATTTNNRELMKTLIKKNKGLLNIPDSDGTTPLMEAAKFGAKETVQILLDAGAKKDLKNNLGSTALDIAKENKNEDALILLSTKSKN